MNEKIEIQLNEIKESIKKLETSIDNFKEELTENFLVDDKILEKEKLDSISTRLEEIKNTII